MVLDVPKKDKGALPFFLAIFLEMVILVFLPDIVLFLPKLMYGA